MLKTLLSATAISALMVSGALAQTANPPASPPPSATPPAASSPTASTSSAKFVTAQKADQWLASKLKGTDVLGPNNEKVGDVNDVLLDRSGKIDAFIVGVGGFLGIGEKDVAIEPSAFQVVPGNTSAVAATTTDATRPAGAPATTTTTTTVAVNDDPNNVKLKISMTKDELKNAPSFERYKAPARTTGAATGTNTGAAGPGDTVPARRP